MGKPRIRGQHTTISIKVGANVVPVGEVSKFSVKELGELKKSRSIGEAGITGNKTFEGYDLSFEGGKVDWKLAQLLHQQDVEVYAGKRAPYFEVTTKFTYYGITEIDTYTYPEVVFHGYSLDVDANDELNEKWEGFCGEKRTYSAEGTPNTDNTSAASTITAAITAALAKDS